MNDRPREMPDLAGGCKLTLIVVAIAFFVAALGTPIEWMPMSSTSAPAIDAAAAAQAPGEPPVDAVVEPHVQAY